SSVHLTLGPAAASGLSSCLPFPSSTCWLPPLANVIESVEAPRYPPHEVTTQWTYEWRRGQVNTGQSFSEFRINRVTESDGGGYSCRGRRSSSWTEWSDITTLRVTGSRGQCDPDLLCEPIIITIIII
uniref:Ig-like domain-containing protein n=1 Tax=Oreochromis niloticus TaxID=8128 RepID=A0A669BM30_ORENI